MRVSILFSRVLLAGCLVSATIPTVFGQDERPGRPQRGQGGGGGPGGGRGMGMGMGMMGGAGGLAGLLMMTEVQDHLKLDETQKDELKGVQEKARDEMRKVFEEMRDAGGGGGGGGGGRGFGMSEEVRKKLADMGTKTEEKIAEILDPSQFDRLVGLFVQQNAMAAINHKLVSEKLKITEEQKAKFKEIEEEQGNKMRELFTGGAGGPPGPESFEKMNSVRKESEEKSMGCLTDEQKKKLEEIKGEKFEFPQRGPGGPGGRRRNNA